MKERVAGLILEEHLPMTIDVTYDATFDEPPFADDQSAG